MAGGNRIGGRDHHVRTRERNHHPTRVAIGGEQQRANKGRGDEGRVVCDVIQGEGAAPERIVRVALNDRVDGDLAALNSKAHYDGSGVQPRPRGRHGEQDLADAAKPKARKDPSMRAQPRRDAGGDNGSEAKANGTEADDQRELRDAALDVVGSGQHVAGDEDRGHEHHAI